MRFPTLRALVVVATLLAAAVPDAAFADGGAASPVLPRAAVRTVALPLPADVVATADRVFISGGNRSEEIAVTDADGTPVAVLDGLPGPTDLLVSRDRRTLYVTLPNVNAIAAYDTASLAPTGYYPTGGGVCPRHLAASDTTLWFGYACDDHNRGGNIGRIDVATGAVTTGLVAEAFYGAPLLDVPAGSGKAVITGQPGLSPGELRVYAVEADGALRHVRTSAHGSVGGNLRDIAVRADDTSVFTASGWPYELVGYGVPELTQQMVLPTSPYPDAVELSPDNALVAGGSDAIYDPDVYVYRATGLKVGSVELGTGAALIDQGLAWSPDGRRLYAVSVRENSPRPTPATLHVITVPH
jgi:hypothetical protein